jgi:acetyl-CoA carboxylase carboxyl transferase subunit beta
VALAQFGKESCVVVGQERARDGGVAPLDTDHLRLARRGMQLADSLHLPLVSVIDTSGAATSKQAEEGGIARQIALCLSELVMLPGVTLSLLLGEGTGGGALALFPADVTLAAQHSWLAPLPPEGSSAVVYRDVVHAAEMAERQQIASVSLLERGLVDEVLPEHPDAALEPRNFCLRVARAIEHRLGSLAQMDPGLRLARRLEKYRNVGISPHAAAPIGAAMSGLSFGQNGR